MFLLVGVNCKSSDSRARERLRRGFVRSLRSTLSPRGHPRQLAKAEAAQTSFQSVFEVEKRLLHSRIDLEGTEFCTASAVAEASM